MKGTKTEQNLRAAVNGEASAALLYEFFAERARKEGLSVLSDIFLETAKNEKAHAKIYLDLLECIQTTSQNLLHAAEAEFHENRIMYPDFAAEAEREGLKEIAATFEMVGKIEAEHEKRFRSLLLQLENNSLFSGGTEKIWICQNCGHHYTGDSAPQICPVCKHPMGYFSKTEK